MDPEAYQLYMDGLYIFDQRDLARFDEAIDLLQQSIEIDPSFAPAHATLADVFQGRASYFMVPTGEANDSAKAQANQAIGIDPNLADAYITLGWARMSADYDWDGAEEAFERAIELDEFNPTAHQSYGQFLVYMDRTEEGLEQLRTAVDLDSLSIAPKMFLGVGLGFAGRWDEAIEQHRKVLQRFSNLAHAHHFLAGALLEEGLFAESMVEIMEAIELGGSQPLFLGLKAIVHGRMGQRDSVNAILDSLMMRKEEGEVYVPPDIIARAHIALGQDDEALQWLERAYNERQQGMVFLKVLARFDPLRSYPRFQALMEKMNFPETPEGAL